MSSARKKAKTTKERSTKNKKTPSKKRTKRKAPQTSQQNLLQRKKKQKMADMIAPVPRSQEPDETFRETMEEKKENFAEDSDDVGWDDDDDAADDWGDIDDEAYDNPQMKSQVNDRLMEQATYELLSPKQIDDLRGDMIKDVVDALFPDADPIVSKDMAISLLQKMSWKKEKVIDTFVMNPEDAMKEWGGSYLQDEEKRAESGLIECPQCYDDVPASQCFSLNCRHQSCRSCWEEYLSFNTKQGKEGVVITCNHAGCKLVVAESAWAKILPASLLSKRKKFVMDHFVSAQPDLVWCPGPNCSNAVKDPMRDSPEVKCDCGTVFCFKCKELSHRPCRCDWAKQWLIKCSSEAENANWILANTKRCPKCQTQIEKNQGCNHMTCRSCSHEFCWLCKGDWKQHGTATGGYYRCNRYEEGKKKGTLSEEEVKAQSAQNELQKYLHYFQRFDNHMKARKFAEKSLDKTMNRMKSLQELKGGGFNDVSFLEEAVRTVIVCRQLLQWTYAMGYYMEPGTKEKDLFEHNQEDLEKNTEHLHELSEKPLEDLKNESARSKIINYTRVTQKFRNNLMNGIETGLTQVL